MKFHLSGKMSANSGNNQGRNRRKFPNKSNINGAMDNFYPGIDATFMLAIEKYVTEFINNHNVTQFEFPNSFTNVHRKYVHNYVRKMGLTSKSHGKGFKFYLLF